MLSAIDAIRYFSDCASGLWKHEIRNILSDLLFTNTHLTAMGLGWSNAIPIQHQKNQASKVVDFMTLMSSNRTWSLLIYETPPYTWAGALLKSKHAQAKAMKCVLEDGNLFYYLEMEKFKDPDMSELYQDIMKDLWPLPVRLAHACYRKDNFKASSDSGSKTLKTMIMVPPDEAIIEDEHQRIRDLQRHSRTFVSSKIQRARACIHSGILERRKLEHSKVSKLFRL